MLTSLSPVEFLIGKALITIFISVIVNIAIFFMLGIQLQYLLMYFIITTAVLISVVEIGIISKNQMATGTIGTPLGLFLFMIPTLSGLNKTFYKIATLLPKYNSIVILKKVFEGKNIIEGSGYNIFVIFALVFFYFFRCCLFILPTN